MRPLPRTLLDTARNRHGLLTVDELAAERYSGRVRAAAVDAGMLVPVHRGIFRIGSHEQTFPQRCAAALLAAPDAVLSATAAGRLWGLRAMASDDVHIIARRAIALDGVYAHRTDFLDGSHVTERRGARVLRPARLLCDLAAFLDEATLESVFEQMLDRRMVTVPLVRSIGRQFMARGRPGTRRLAWLLDARPEWLRPAESDLEVRLWRALARRGIEAERQRVVVLDGGDSIRLDLAVPDVRFGIEVDHVTWHGGRLDAQADKQRDRRAARIGWTISRVTDDDVSNRLETTCDEIIAILRSIEASRPI